MVFSLFNMAINKGFGFKFKLNQIIFLTALLLVPLASGGCSTLDTKVEVQHLDRAGKMDRRITRTTRDGVLIYLRAETTMNAKADHCFEFIFHKGKPIFSMDITAATESRKASITRDFIGRNGIGIGEMDTDGDGLCDLLVVSGPKGELIEVFRRDKEGHLAPLSDKELESKREYTKRVAAGIDALVKGIGQEDNEDDDPELR
jgi:hypothetical protein